MKKCFKHIILGILAVVATGCIENDIPYPVIGVEVLGIDVEGTASNATINNSEHKIVVELAETTDIRRVKINSMDISEGGRCDVTFPGLFDLRTPLYFNLSTHHSWEWTLEATQNIERYFTVEGQIGKTEWNISTHSATAYVGFDDRSNVRVTSVAA